ncbi:arginine-tRNA-protein transferase [Limtongia smithiae]|uniref:arginine-tRNA-protein transferase n=1 Tax=Limtongia smithiae TaxID=1125753 RepID=UPI0034CEDD5C
MILKGAPISAFDAGAYTYNRHCGYCGSKAGSATFSFGYESLTVEDYQELMDRGFRRSGKYLYKPDLLNSCCPQYAIRLAVAQFKPSKEHRQAINRFNRFVLGEEYENALKKYAPGNAALGKGKNNQQFDLETAIHRCETTFLPHDLPSATPTRPAHSFYVTIVAPDFTAEKFALFSHYQQTTHHDKPSEITPSSFTRFLCGRPFEHGMPDDEVYAAEDRGRSGLWHQMYYLDSELIAMGVLDFLPNTVSSVYFMYREEYARFNLGKLSACREAALALAIDKEFYHMGFYVNSCQKMRYKTQFAPSELLDPETYIYHPVEKFNSLFTKSEYVSFAANCKVRSPEADAQKGALWRRTEARRKRMQSDGEEMQVDEDEGENDEDGEEEDWSNVKAKPLFQTTMPGIISSEEVSTKFNPGDVLLYLSRQQETLTFDLITRLTMGTQVRLLSRVKTSLYELAASVGVELAQRAVAVR